MVDVIYFVTFGNRSVVHLVTYSMNFKMMTYTVYSDYGIKVSTTVT